MKKIFTFLFIIYCFATVQAANVTFTFTNLLTGMPDTNPVAVYAVRSYAAANGSVNTIGPPIVFYPNTNGFYEWTNMPSGIWKAVNLAGGFGQQAGYGPGQPGTPAGILFWIDGTTNTYPFTYYARSFSDGGGFNVFNMVSGLIGGLGTNGIIVTITNGTIIVDGSGVNLNISFAGITNALGYVPANATNLFSTVIYTNNTFTFLNPTNGTLFINTNYDFNGAAAAVLTYASGASNILSIYSQGSSNTLAGLIATANANIAAVSNNANTFYLYSTGASNTLYVNLTGNLVTASNVLNAFHLSDLAYSVAASNSVAGYAQGASNAVESNLVNTNTLLVALAVTSSNAAVTSATSNAKNMTNGLGSAAFHPATDFDATNTASSDTNVLMSLLGSAAYANTNRFDTNNAYLYALTVANAYTLAVSNYFILNGVGSGVSATTVTNIATSLINILGSSVTNFTLLIANNNTNYTLVMATANTNFTVATATSLTNLIFSVAQAGSNNVSASVTAAGTAFTNAFIAQYRGVATNLVVTNLVVDKITFVTNGTVLNESGGGGLTVNGNLTVPNSFIYAGNGFSLFGLGGSASAWYPTFSTSYAEWISNAVNVQSFTVAAPLVNTASNVVAASVVATNAALLAAIQATNTTLVASIITVSNQVYNAQSNTLQYAIGASNVNAASSLAALNNSITASNYAQQAYAPTSSPTIFTPTFWGAENFAGVQWRWQTNGEVAVTNLSSVDVLGNQLYDRISSTVWLATNFVFTSQLWTIVTNGSTCLLQSNSFTIATATFLNGPWTLTGGTGNTPGSYIASQAFGPSIRWKGPVQADSFTGNGSNLWGIVNAGSLGTNTANVGSLLHSRDGIIDDWTSGLRDTNSLLYDTNATAGLNFAGVSTLGTVTITNLVTPSQISGVYQNLFTTYTGTNCFAVDPINGSDSSPLGGKCYKTLSALNAARSSGYMAVIYPGLTVDSGSAFQLPDNTQIYGFVGASLLNGPTMKLGHNSVIWGITFSNMVVADNGTYMNGTTNDLMQNCTWLNAQAQDCILPTYNFIGGIIRNCNFLSGYDAILGWDLGIVEDTDVTVNYLGSNTRSAFGRPITCDGTIVKNCHLVTTNNPIASCAIQCDTDYNNQLEVDNCILQVQTTNGAATAFQSFTTVTGSGYAFNGTNGWPPSLVSYANGAGLTNIPTSGILDFRAGETNLTSATSVIVIFSSPLSQTTKTNYTVTLEPFLSGITTPEITVKTTNGFTATFSSFTGDLDYTETPWH